MLSSVAVVCLPLLISGCDDGSEGPAPPTTPPEPTPTPTPPTPPPGPIVLAANLAPFEEDSSGERLIVDVRRGALYRLMVG
jgi:hypothetical protein